MNYPDLGEREWLELVKRTREKFGVSIQEAHDRIFADEEMRRLVAPRINSVPACRKMATRDLARHREKSRFTRHGDRLRFRRPDGQRP
ncbi:hypothetical protein MTR62_20220 [Novosphingobium sp. 1949]|uniref:Uncharacterized protein n=1 Tax=Novosphingobium organovorum TaxID=2930092 RepID=A0ABT0BIU8_9SPHN|nr:hypothetical protein [Novosphingobium organovorum]MCJ2184992.1 hypothetical protein [Novosphingobium organovorum]